MKTPLRFLLLLTVIVVICSCQPVQPVTSTAETEQAKTLPTNQAPIVDAGAAQTVTLPGVALLEGQVLDDGNPNASGEVTAEWSVVEGDGDVTFTNASALDTAASFSTAGVYTLRLTADDGEYTASDQLTVTVDEIEGMSVIRVPEDAPTVQAGIDLAKDGDLVLVAPGEYHEQIALVDKTITVASWYYTSGDPSYVDQTILDGENRFVFFVFDAVGPETTITGFTIRNGHDGISARSRLNILYNHFTDNDNGIAYDSGGGLCRKNTFDDNFDAIDLDYAVDIVIEDNVLANSGDNGIKIRLHPYTGPLLDVVIRRNLITGNADDGIQLVGHGVPTDRVYVIEGNVISGNLKAGLGLMDEGHLRDYVPEDYRGASLPERILLVNNTFIDNEVGVSGGDNLIALNNIFVGHATSAANKVDGDSIAAYNLMWDNGEDQTGSNLDETTTVYADPLLDADSRLLVGSPAIDAGVAQFSWNSLTVLDMQPNEYRGAAPDIGAYESPVVED
jgi:hypothetical protein